VFQCIEDARRGSVADLESTEETPTMFMVLERKGGTSGPAIQVGHGHSTRDQALVAIKSYLKSFKISGRNLEEGYWWVRDSEGLRKCWIASAD
jgi:hypothetical protein